MKKIFYALLFACIVHSSCKETDSPETGNDFSQGTINGIEYKMYELRELYMRYVSSSVINHAIADSIYNLGLKDKLLYFHSGMKPNRGEEYAFYDGSAFYSIYDPDTSEFNVDYNDYLRRTYTFTENKHMHSRAYIISQDFVKSQLTNPSSARFPRLDFTVSTISENTYEVRAYVDAQNSFGATIRTKYRAVLKHRGGDWKHEANWSVIKLSID